MDTHPLDRIRIARPCRSEWGLMQGDERARHCSNCDKTVYNLAGMGRQEAMDLVAAREGRICVRLFRRPDGTVVTSDCGGRAVAGHGRLRVLAVTAAAMASVAGLAAWASPEPLTEHFPGWGGDTAVMGEMAMPQDWPPPVEALPEPPLGEAVPGPIAP